MHALEPIREHEAPPEAGAGRAWVWNLAAVGLLLAAAYGVAVFLTFRLWDEGAADAQIRQLARDRYAIGLLLQSLPVALLGVVGAALLVATRAGWRTPGPRPALWRAAQAVWPLGLLMPVLWFDEPAGRALLGAALVGVVAWRAWPLLARDSAPEPSERTERAERRLALLAAAVSGAILFVMALQRHRAHWSSLIDLGLFYELYDNAEGQLLYAPTLGQSFLGEHFSPILALLWPLMKLAPSPVTLLAVQAAAIAGGGYLLFLWARARTGHGLLSAALMLAYVWNPYVQQAAVYDFHMDMLEPPLLFGLMLALERRRTAWVWVCAVGLWCTKEDTFIYTSAIGAWAFLFERRRALGAALVVVGLAQAALVLGLVLPALRQPHDPAFFSTTGATEGYHFLGRYSHLGGSFGGLLSTLLLNPAYVVQHLFTGGRLVSVMALVLPFGALALFGGWRLLLLVPALEMLLADPGRMSHFGFYYGAVVIPFGAIAAVEGARRLLARPAAAAPDARFAPSRLAFAVAATVVVTGLWHPSSVAASHQSHQAWVRTPHQLKAEALMERIPAGARVSATGYLAVHLQPGRDVAMFPYALDRADWVLVDLQRPTWPTSYEQVQSRLRQTLSRPGWRLEAAEDGLVLLSRGPEPLAPAEVRQQRATLDAMLDQPVVEAELSEQTAFRSRAVHDTGGDPEASNGAYVEVGPSDRRGPGHLLFGPYARLSPGEYEAVARLRYRQAGLLAPSPETHALTFDVLAQRGGLKAEVKATVAELTAAGDGWRELTLPFTASGGERGFEFRLWYGDVGELALDKVEVRRKAR